MTDARVMATYVAIPVLTVALVPPIARTAADSHCQALRRELERAVEAGTVSAEELAGS